MGFDPISMTAAVIGAGAMSMFNKPNIPNANIPPPPPVGLPPGYDQQSPSSKPSGVPNAPISASDTAAWQRARANQNAKGVTALVLSKSPPSSGRLISPLGVSGGVSRTTLVGG